MTIDKAKLKALAEAMLRDEQGAELSDEEVRGFPEAVRSYEAMTAPSAVLALLAEIERLAADEQEATALCSRLSDLLRDVALAVRGPEEPLKRHGFADLPSRVKAVVAERDQLKAENEDYKSGQERYEQIIEDLKADNEALRKALGEISGQVDGNIRCAVRDVVNCRGDVQDIYGYCDNIDEIIEVAMAKEAAHG
ncbi:hypothetical protein [Pseudomonas guariconensis]|uniref:hypothetical protein n=1 Tax=Pseudomonas guariconensis TaxID=1288410 RepID=UPI002D1EF6BF|nr:hypothetical protein [Pseudomonas guariconensis]MEB3843966.1 hypothetical protein [Pseudomonas guariconensis]MEB3876834.1 hypothetical protein [Pseudomonas guariconensis]MEB3881706.1 hypothetical protein [Pseudomonas guariconensis]MEB3898515.1 hypothetical protein [Pseudomonas guariconensis]